MFEVGTCIYVQWPLCLTKFNKKNSKIQNLREKREKEKNNAIEPCVTSLLELELRHLSRQQLVQEGLCRYRATLALEKFWETVCLHGFV